MTSGFDAGELDLWAEEILNIAMKDMPKKSKKFINQEGQKLKKKAKQKAKQTVKKKTGNYLKGIKKGKVYTYSGNGALSVRVYGAAPHSHLLEQGHNIKNKKDGAVLGRTRAFYVLDKSGREFQQEYQNDIENFIDEIVREL